MRQNDEYKYQILQSHEIETPDKYSGMELDGQSLEVAVSFISLVTQYELQGL